MTVSDWVDLLRFYLLLAAVVGAIILAGAVMWVWAETRWHW